MRRKRRNRIIEVLRREWPDLTWRYEFPSIWVSSAGWQIQAFSRLSPRYDGDDEGCESCFIRSDTNEELWLLGLW